MSGFTVTFPTIQINEHKNLTNFLFENYAECLMQNP